ncbi:MAG: CpsD/CapB family tyrosine-protein kinase [Oscillospiraceae bacterium]|jgi:capsular exopolysaccharide synthesis family protein|nr:CpsD/CapB family tyrosine-protein kinase [Oscillospiraceae bacterium]
MAENYRTSYKPYYKSEGSLRDNAAVLYANIKFSSIDNPVKTIVLTSTIPAEGKTSIIIFLAMAIAEQGKSVLIIDADLRRPRVGRYLGRRNEIGFVNYIFKEAPLDSVVCPTTTSNVYFMDCGSKIPNSIEIFESEKFDQMLKFLRTQFDYVLLDTPPVSMFIDAAVIAPKADGAVLVCGYGQTSQKQAKDSVEQLKNANANIIGCVLNKIPEKRLMYGNNKRYLRYYGYDVDKKDKTKRKGGANNQA